jgi:3-oxoacyl-[acyl-carrier-protein] synthase III
MHSVATPEATPAWSPADDRLRVAGIAAIGVSVPAQVVPNAPIARRLGVDESWIVARTGVHERRHAAPGETLEQFAAAAGQAALERAGVAAERLDLVLVATCTQDALLPNAAPLVAERLGGRRAGALDLGAACTGFLSGLAVASGQVESGRAECALVIGADLLSRLTDHDDPRTAALFGDGAGAAVVTAGGPGRVGSILLRADGSGASCLRASHAERLIRMRGQDTFRAAVARLCESTLEALDAAELGLEDVDLFVYHQANGRITAAVGERLGLPPERVVDCIARYGNTSAASIPIALAEAESAGRLRPGSRVLVSAFGAGFVWGAGVIEWGA